MFVCTVNEVLNRMIFTNSDIITFHNYNTADQLAKHIASLTKHERPIINTEWLNRGRSSLVETCLPMFAKEKAGCMHWGQNLQCRSLGTQWITEMASRQ